jgi:hypothetical protein
VATTASGFWYPDTSTPVAPLHTLLATMASSSEDTLNASFVPKSVANATAATALKLGQLYYQQDTKRVGIKTAAAGTAGNDLLMRDVAGSQVWSSPAFSIPNNTPYGLGTLTGLEIASGTAGPAPATPAAGGDLFIPNSGFYTVGLSIYCPGASTGSYVRMQFPWDRPEVGFNSNFVAAVTRAGYLAAGTTVHFEILQTSGVTRTTAWTLSILCTARI